MQRTLDPLEYISEIIEEGKIIDCPNLTNRISLYPTYVIERSKKYVIALQTKRNMMQSEKGIFVQENERFGTDFTLAYFPTNLTHAHYFANSVVKRGGPQRKVPGSACVLEADYTCKRLDVHYIQYCFKQGSPKELTRSIASKYMGARERLLHALFSLNIIEDLQTLIFRDMLVNTGAQRSLENVLKAHPIMDEFRREQDYIERQK